MYTHGTARWAGWGELRAQGLLGSPSGLLVGFAEPTENGFEPIRYRGDLHQLIIGGTGGGKFTTALAPMLLGSGFEGQTVVVVDPKGEIARLTGPFFQSPFAQEPDVFLLDPWDQCGTGSTSALNVLADITLANPNYVDDARALADAMIIPSGAENTHWDNAARNFLTSVILFVALDPSEDGRRDLIRVRDLVTLSWAMPKAYKGPRRETLSALLMEHLVSDLAGGAVKRGFASLMNREDKERSGILSSIERDTAWIDSPQMQSVLRGSSLDLSKVADAGNKYYIVLPPDYFMTHRAWLRLMVTAFAKAMKRHRAPQDRPRDARWRHIVIDEFANLGEMSFVLEDVAVARGFDVKYHFAIQDLSQLRRVYQEGWESFINNTFQRFFAVGDLFTADYVSRMLGAATVKSFGSSTAQGMAESWADGSGKSTNTGTNFGSIFSTATHGRSMGESVSHTETVSRNSSETTSTSEVQRPLYTPDEVRRLDADRQILFFRGMHPIWSWRPPYWQMFPSLPRLSLADVLATVGRQPQGRAELAHFTNWRPRGSLIRRPSRPRFSWLRHLSPLIDFLPRLEALPSLIYRAFKFLLVAAVVLAGCFVFLGWFFSTPPTTASRFGAAQITQPTLSVGEPVGATTRPSIPLPPGCSLNSVGTRECSVAAGPATAPTRDANNPVNVPSAVNPLADRPMEVTPLASAARQPLPTPPPAMQAATPAAEPRPTDPPRPAALPVLPRPVTTAPALQPANPLSPAGTETVILPSPPATQPQQAPSAEPVTSRQRFSLRLDGAPPKPVALPVLPPPVTTAPASQPAVNPLSPSGTESVVSPPPPATQPQQAPSAQPATARQRFSLRLDGAPPPAAQPSPAPAAPPAGLEAPKRRFSLRLDGEDDCAVRLAGRTVTGFSLTCNRITVGASLGTAGIANSAGTLEECASKCRAIAACASFSYSLKGSSRDHACNIFAKGGTLNVAVGWVTGHR